MGRDIEREVYVFFWVSKTNKRERERGRNKRMGDPIFFKKKFGYFFKWWVGGFEMK